MSDVPFVSFAFAPTGASTPRTMPDRLAEVINVKDFGAKGDFSHDDHNELQAAFNAAFTNATQASNYTTAPGGGAPVPNGLNTSLNKPVYFPPGNYLFSGTLNLTGVVGGLIYGDGPGASSLRNTGSPGFAINGCVGTIFHSLLMDGGGISQSDGRIGFDLGWDNDAAKIGLHDITFFQVNWGGGQYGMRVARQGFGGKNINFIQCGIANCGEGIRVEGDDCLVNFIGTATAENWIGVRVVKGNFINSGISNAGSNPSGSTPAQLDFLHESTGTTIVWGGRSESSYLADVTAGKFIGVGLLHQGGTVHGRSVKVSAGATANLIGCELGNIYAFDGAAGYLAGAGDFFLKNVTFPDTPNPINLSTASRPEGAFTGRICQYVGKDTFTIAQLPKGADGLLLPISNSNTATWGATIGPSTGSSKVLGRYNSIIPGYTVAGV